MSALFISDDELNQRLNSEKNSLVTVVHKDPGKDKKHSGTLHLNNELRSIIGAYAKITTQKEAAEIFGVTQPSAGAYEKGMIGKKNVAELKEKVESKTEKINDRAMSILMDTLNVITPEKVSDLKVREAASVAKDISSIVKNISPPPTPVTNYGQVIFVSPKTSIEEEYEVIDAIVEEKYSE